MPRTKSGNFDQNKYIAEWKKQNMKSIKVTYRNEFVDQFKTACSKLGISQSAVIKKAMEETIKKAEL